jgi:hypothetical protein
VYLRPVWEYQHLIRPLPPGAADDAALTSLGQEGWELVGVVADAGAAHFYLKRLVQ